MLKKFARVSGIALVLTGLAGWVPNAVVGTEGFFETNTAHNIAHILLGGYLAFVGQKKPETASMSLKIVAAIFLFLTIGGFIIGEGKLLGFLSLNDADNWLHLVLAIVFAAAGMSEVKASVEPLA